MPPLCTRLPAIDAQSAPARKQLHRDLTHFFATIQPGEHLMAICPFRAYTLFIHLTYNDPPVLAPHRVAVFPGPTITDIHEGIHSAMFLQTGAREILTEFHIDWIYHDFETPLFSLTTRVWAHMSNPAEEPNIKAFAQKLLPTPHIQHLELLRSRKNFRNDFVACVIACCAVLWCHDTFMAFDPHALALYPTDPGVYLMKDAEGRILYIGKAKNLRARLRQYWGKGDTRARVPYLLAQVAAIDTVITLTEKDALILEHQLVQRHLPKYNVLLKDDKSFIRLLLTQHKWPMVRLTRRKERGESFGPYTNVAVARHTLDLIAKLFPLRQCSDVEFAQRERPCLLYEMKRCLAPCVGKCTEAEYGRQVEAARRFLQGRNQEVLQALRRQMREASEALEFERAAHLLRMLEHITEKQSVEAHDCDVFGLARAGDAVLVVQLQFRNHTLVASQHFRFHQVAEEDREVLEALLFQKYHHQPPIPLLTPLPLSPHLRELLATTIEAPRRGARYRLIEMATRNAQALLKRHTPDNVLLALQETLHLTRFPRHIECLDISHISGTDTVAGLVGFVQGERALTRRYRVHGRDEYAAMREALERRFASKDELCDLLIVDGGKGQLHLALDVLHAHSIATVDVIALSKEEARHDKGLTQEQVHLPTQPDPILLPPRSPLLFFLQRIRDEAHRTALAYQRKRRTQRALASSLDDIPGIGPIKKRRLLRHFGSAKAVRNASPSELARIPGLTRRDIELIKKPKEP